MQSTCFLRRALVAAISACVVAGAAAEEGHAGPTAHEAPRASAPARDAIRAAEPAHEPSAAPKAAPTASAPVAVPAARAASGIALTDLAAAARKGDGHEKPPVRTPPTAVADRAGERPAAPTPTSTAEPPRPAIAAGNDAIERLQQRLAEKLGSVSQPTQDGSVLLRVPTRTVAAAASTRSGSRRTGSAAPGADPQETVLRHGAPAHWSYDGNDGPFSWGRLDPDYATCASGQRQSPIDIRDGFAVALEPIQFDYRPTAFRVIDNGHTVQVNLAPGNAITVAGRRYDLLQFHFHRPSEERIDGKSFDMVAHLVHRDAEGRLAVVAVLINRGSSQPVLERVWANLPLEKGDEQAARETIDLNELLPPDRRYYTYMGSLTTPPCTEGVLWMVMKQPMPAADAQVNLFARLYPMNARPIQASAGRIIKESN